MVVGTQTNEYRWQLRIQAFCHYFGFCFEGVLAVGYMSGSPSWPQKGPHGFVIIIVVVIFGVIIIVVIVIVVIIIVILIVGVSIIVVIIITTFAATCFDGYLLP